MEPYKYGFVCFDTLRKFMWLGFQLTSITISISMLVFHIFIAFCATCSSYCLLLFFSNIFYGLQLDLSYFWYDWSSFNHSLRARFYVRIFYSLFHVFFSYLFVSICISLFVCKIALVVLNVGNICTEDAKMLISMSKRQDVLKWCNNGRK